MKKKHLVEALEDGLLIKRLRDGEDVIEAINKRLPEGYAITATTEDLTDWRNWKAGDLVTVHGRKGGFPSYKGGKAYGIKTSDYLDGFLVESEHCDGEYLYFNTSDLERGDLRFHSRPSTEDRSIKTWRVGDWVECIDPSRNSMSGISKGDIRQITSIEDNGTNICTGGPTWGNENSYRLVRRADEPAPVVSASTAEVAFKEGDMIEITEPEPARWWKTGNLHPVISKDGALGTYDLDGYFRRLPLAVKHHKVPR